jgi:hypothetical protein
MPSVDVPFSLLGSFIVEYTFMSTVNSGGFF